ncbi:glycerophosphodiester phosphodiesterase [Anaerocolumna sp. MB42-C2]|uniref:glycerophosphodiester phosphodiesterase n=1 Tax=Anaerocolumna sp. MB42-C2 TaxID=3070997 RepID=UPI0027E18DAF|nr:glycerophosphodiester phosphodiesterase [Anaerocolumna sp. MB42-C2]WMJ90252.1 glycerophosphodiester phosphodiesterase [Anaerocolumna sp. MB42-C2]
MTLITAHSGCDQTKDNSLEFLKYALNTKADCLEVDVQKNEKGILVLSHDEADNNAPLLEAAFLMLKEYPDKKINCDLKQRELELEIYKLAEKTGVNKQLIYSGNVDLELIKKGNSRLPQVDIFLNIEILLPEIEELCASNNTELLDQGLKRAAMESLNYEIKCINMDYRLCTESFLVFLKENGILCSAWTVNEESILNRFLDYNIYNITTRTVSAALTIRAGWN